MIYIVAIGVGLKYPRKIHSNTVGVAVVIWWTDLPKYEGAQTALYILLFDVQCNRPAFLEQVTQNTMILKSWEMIETRYTFVFFSLIDSKSCLTFHRSNSW